MKAIHLRMSWRNVWRNPRRSLLTMGAISFATLLLIFMLSWQFGSYATMINAAVGIQTGHLQVQAKGYQDDRDMARVVPAPEEIAAMIRRIPGVEAVTLRANAFSLVSSTERTYGALVIGIDPAREKSVSTLDDMVREGRFLSADGTHDALAGQLLARNLRVSPGAELILLGQGRDGSIAATAVSVEGTFRSGQDEFDRSTLSIPLRTFQDVYSMNRTVHEVVVRCRSLEDVPPVKQALTEGLHAFPGREDLVVLDWKELMPGLVQSIQLDLVSGFIFYIILIVVVAFSIMNTFLMAILERTREFGALMAMGVGPWRLARLLIMESAIMSLLGAGAGIILGSGVTWYFQLHGILISSASELLRQFGLPERMYPQLSVLSVAIGSGIVLVITQLTALYPAFRVRRLRPVEAMAAT